MADAEDRRRLERTEEIAMGDKGPGSKSKDTKGKKAKAGKKKK